MRRSTISLLGVFLLGVLFAQSPQTFNLDPYNPEYDPHTVLVKFKDEAQLNNSFAKTSTQSGITAIDNIISKYDVTSVENVFKNAKPSFGKRTFIDLNGEEHTIPNLDKIYKIKYEADIDPKDLVEELKQEPSLDYAEPDYYVYMTLAPDDPFYQSGDQWHIDAVNAPAAWDSTTSDTSQLIAIIDTGVDWDHPDLDDNIWINRAELNGIDGVDDDGNGYVDDIRGWDFINDDNDPNDDNSHGTHVAGIAAAEMNNSIGIAGIAPNARIMPIKVLQSSGSGNSSDFAAGIDYAAQNGATVINMSMGSYGESITVKTALENAYAYAVLVAAAGNDGYKVDPPCPPLPIYAPMYPACYSFVIGVEATTSSNSRASFSNYDPSGPVSVGNSYNHNYEMKAPGVGIYSSVPNGNYRSLSGTSMASPIVAGAVALMKSYNPTQSTEQVFAKLIQSSNGGVLDIDNALDYELEPDLVYLDYTLVDTLPGCDGDGIADAGETVEIYFTVKNAGGYADSVWSKLHFGEFEDTTTARILDSTSYIGDISAYGTMTGVMDPIRVKIDENVANNRDIVFECEIGGEECSIINKNLNITVQNGIELSGIYTDTTILYPNKYYIVTESVVFENLIVKPGVTIRVNPSKTILVINNFISKGTKDSLIIYTNNKAGYWYGISTQKEPKDVVLEYCVLEYLRAENNKEFLTGFAEVKNCIIQYNLGPLNHYSRNTRFISNNILYNYQDIMYTYTGHSFMKAVDDFYYNIIYKNTSKNISPAVTVETSILDKVKNNIFLSNKHYDLGIYGTFNIVDILYNYYGTIDSNYVNNVIRDYFEDSTCPAANISISDIPSDSAHGIVWKIDINNVLTNKYDNPYNSTGGLGVIGAETLKFDVYFNRAMDTTKTPFLTFGVREPYTQHIVADDASWSSDSTIWTAYYDVGLETGDGIQRIRVANAQDDEHFEIPVEDSRFEFVIQAAGAASIAFNGTPGIGKVDLEWPSAETDDILGYNMYRAMRVNDSTWTDTSMINTSLVTDTVYTDFNVIPNTTYRYLYTIIGTDMAESDFSKAIAATPFSAANGDANGDMAVNVLDIISIVSYMLEDDPAPFLFDAADLNGDDVINVLDIIGVISIIINDGMGKQAYADATESIFSVKDKKIMASSNGAIGGYQFIVNGDIKDLNISSEYPMEVVTHKVTEDKMLVMVYSLTGNVIPEGNHSILNLSTTKDITFSDLVVADSRGQAVSSQFGDGGGLIPKEFKLEQNYPNPFNATTTIAYQLPKASDVSLKVYNLLGQTVYMQQITDQRPGYYHYTWQGMDNTGHFLPSGLYIYRIMAGDFTDSKKMILLK